MHTTAVSGKRPFTEERECDVNAILSDALHKYGRADLIDQVLDVYRAGIMKKKEDTNAVQTFDFSDALPDTDDADEADNIVRDNGGHSSA